MNYQCFSDNCVSKPVAYCLCRGIPSLFCVEDSINHSKNYKDHRIFDIVTCPLSETQIDLLKISNLKNTLKNTQKSLLSESIEIVKLIHVINQNSQNEIGKLIKDCDEIILRVALHHRNNEVINHYSTMSRFNSDKTINNLKYFYDNMMRNYKQLKDQIREALDISKFNINDSTGDEIIFFTNLTKQSIFLNLDSLKIE